MYLHVPRASDVTLADKWDKRGSSIFNASPSHGYSPSARIEIGKRNAFYRIGVYYTQFHTHSDAVVDIRNTRD